MQNIDNTRERMYKKGEFLFKEAEQGTELFIIQSGQVKVYRTEKGTVYDIGVFGKGSVLGELALFDNCPRSASAEVSTDCRVVYVDKEHFDQQLEKVPGWLAAIIKILAKRLRDTSRRVQDSSNKDLSGNVALLLFYFLPKHGKRGAQGEIISMQIANKEICAVLGVELELLVRQYETLVKKELVKIEDGNLVVPKADLLELYSQYKSGTLKLDQSKLSADAGKLLTEITAYAEKHGTPSPDGVAFDLIRFYADMEKMTGKEMDESLVQELAATQLVKIDKRGKPGSNVEQQRLIVDKQSAKKMADMEKLVQMFAKE
jgi:CRP/FNR family transcriptional regulator